MRTAAGSKQTSMAMEGHRSEPTSVIVTQLPKEAYRRPINDYFGQIGPVVRSHLVRDNGKYAGEL